MEPPRRFVIEGKPITKKNSKRIVRRGSGRPFLISSDAYREWEASAVVQLRMQWRGKEPLEGEWNAAILSYLGPRQRPDASNLYEGPQDALQLAGVVVNDSQIVSHDGSRMTRDPTRPRVEITLTRAEVGP
jgi:Holliday junction resolvase RusA-like endonuclease